MPSVIQSVNGDSKKAKIDLSLVSIVPRFLPRFATYICYVTIAGEEHGATKSREDLGNWGIIWFLFYFTVYIDM